MKVLRLLGTKGRAGTHCGGLSLTAAMVLLAAMGPLAGPALADADQAAIPEVLTRYMRPGQAIERYLSEVMQPFRDVAHGGSEIDQAAVDKVRDAAEATARQQILARYLPLDADTDGKVTRDEVVRFLTERFHDNAAVIDRQVAEYMKLDTNNDGVVDLAEMRAAAQPNGNVAVVQLMLDLSPRKDGHLSASQLIKAAQDAFAAADTDGDSMISRDEFERVRRTVNSAPVVGTSPAAPRSFGSRMSEPPSCSLPALDPGARLVLYGTSEGAAFSDTAVSGLNEMTRAARVQIEPGAEQVYLILSATVPMIWRFEGDTSRIARLVLASTRSNVPGDLPAVGVTGIDKARVTFLAPGQCFGQFYASDSIEAAVAKGAVTRALGRAPDNVSGSRITGVLKVPSLAAEMPDIRDFTASMPNLQDSNLTSIARDAPAGMLAIQSDAVISLRKAERYDVLPGSLGIAVLVAQGALRPLGGQQYKILKSIPRIPATSSGRFLLGAGLSLPPENIGSACVVSEDTGLSIRGLSAGCQ